MGLYIAGIVYALAAPPRQHDPHKGVAQGCLGIVALALVIPAGLLALAITRHIPWLTYTLFALTCFPAIGLIGGGITHLVQRRRGVDL